jgi:hypothetical protein
MKTKKCFLVAVIFMALAFTFSGCSSDSGGGGGNPAENRISFVSGVYELVIEKALGGAANSPESGDSYKLLQNDNEISRGTISISGSNYTFTPDADNGGASFSFNATYGGGDLTITSEVKDKNGNVVPLDSMTLMNWGPNGTWISGSIILVVAGDFNGGTYNWDSGRDRGTYTAIGNTFVATSNSGSEVASAYLVNYNTMSVTVHGEGTFSFTRQ